MIVSTCLIVIFLLIIYEYVYKPTTYWKKLNFPYETPIPLFGNQLWTILKTKTSHDTFIELHQRTKANEKVMGIHFMTKPVLFVKDLDLIRQIAIKHFDHFVNHSDIFLNLESEKCLQDNLVNIKDEHWRHVRATLSPAFTGNKLRWMFSFIEENAENLCKYFHNIIESNPKGVAEIPIKDVLGRFSNDVIANVAFGVSVNSLEEKDNEFFLMGKRAVRISFWKLALNNLFGPHFLKFFNTTLLDKKATDYLIRVFQQTVKARREQGIVRNDMIQLLLEAQKQTKEQAKGDNSVEVLSDDEILAQAFLFFFAGYDSIATTLTFALLELALNPQIQDEASREIMKYEKLSYEIIGELKILDRIISETQRKWPSLAMLDRVCTKDFQFESGGKTLTVKAGTPIFLSKLGHQMDPEIYPDPEKFDPDRFMEENIKKRHPCAFLSFGSGPRICIGTRFAHLEMKIMLANTLKIFEFQPTKNTPIPIKLNKSSVMAHPASDMLRIQKRQA